MADVQLDPPPPRLEGRRQPGVTDPVWPLDVPSGVDATTYRDVYAGRIERQRHLHLVAADVCAQTPGELRGTLETLSSLARREMARPPSSSGRPLDSAVTSRRVSITIGFGPSLFTTSHGDDRFGIAGLRPSWLKVIPRVEGDSGFQPRDVATDLVLLVQSDDVYVNEWVLGLLLYKTPEIRVRAVERGYSRPDSREPSGFEDGGTNPIGGSGHSEMEKLVYVEAADQEPTWCIDGTYLAYRKIRRQLTRFFDLPGPEREAVFGVDAATGTRLPVPRSDAHAHKMNLKRKGHDFLGITDDERRLLRRPYFFNDGLDSSGLELRGVHHLSFARDLMKQYEWPVLMWQTNPDFPTPGAGMDALYGLGGASNISAGYYFIPAAADGASFIGAALLG
jgi:deferrochelatase/peroxidase EfeB